MNQKICLTDFWCNANFYNLLNTYKCTLSCLPLHVYQDLTLYLQTVTSDLALREEIVVSC